MKSAYGNMLTRSTPTGSSCHLEIRCASKSWSSNEGDCYFVLNFSHNRQLADRFGVGSVPKLIVISNTGETITKKGRKEVQDKGVVAFRHWATIAGGLASADNKILDDL
jgi:hypothetical protein